VRFEISPAPLRGQHRKLCSGGDSEFIQSLARCKAWQATGGKSGSAFARTLGTTT
jgi:hypothetical protein